jgi:hypothetical protein
MRDGARSRIIGQTMDKKRSRGREAPMVIWPSDVVRVARQIAAAIRRRARR